MAVQPHLTCRGRTRARPALTVLVLTAVLTGCGDQEADAPADGGTSTGEAVAFVAADIAYEDAPGSLTQGSHTFELVNEGALPHTVTIEELDDRDVVEAGPGTTATGEVELEAGSYTYYCSVPGHRQGGMEGTLEVADG